MRLIAVTLYLCARVLVSVFVCVLRAACSGVCVSGHQTERLQ